MGVREHYDRHPEQGMRRYWVGWFAHVESYPVTDFPYWKTGDGLIYQLRPSLRTVGLEKGLPAAIPDRNNTPVDQAEVDAFYYAESIFEGLVDAPESHDDEALDALLKSIFGPFALIGHKTQDQSLRLSQIEAKGRHVYGDGRDGAPSPRGPIF